MITCEDLCYAGMKVKVENAEHNLYGLLLKDYNQLGYLYVKEHFNNSAVLTFDGTMISLPKSVLIPIVEDNLIEVMEKKKKQIKVLQKEVDDIENFGNKVVKEIMGIGGE